MNLQAILKKAAAFAVALSLSILLTSCGGGGGGGGGSGSGGGDTATVLPASTPTIKLGVSLVEVSSSEMGTATVSWLAGSDDPAVASTLQYEIHMNSPEGEFAPSSETLKFQGKAVLSTTVRGLPGGRYATKLLLQQPVRPGR